jgi:hypothetical protein
MLFSVLRNSPTNLLSSLYSYDGSIPELPLVHSAKISLPNFVLFTEV